MPKFDTDQIRRDVALSEYLPTRGIELKRDGSEWLACCPFHSDKTASFQVYQGGKGTQEFKCQGCGVSGDVIEFVQQWDTASFTEACEILGGERTISSRAPVSGPVSKVDFYAAWVAKLPPPDAPVINAGRRTPQLFNPKRIDKPVTSYVPSMVFPYRMPDGRLIGYVLRIDLPDHKITPCILWCENAETGEIGWCHRPMAQEGRRPYGVERLSQHPSAQVLIVEGEKSADAAARLLPGMAPLAWVGGTQNVSKTDWSHVAGREVIIWPDNDEPGTACAAQLAGLVTAAGALRVKVLTPPGEDKPKGWDIADAEEEGWTTRECMTWARPRARQWPFEEETAEAAPEQPEAASDEPREDDARFSAPPAEPEAVEQLRTTDNVVPLPVKKRREPRDDGPREPIRGDVWRHLILTDDKRAPKTKVMTNFVAMLTHHEAMEGVLAQNSFSHETTLLRRPPWDRGTGRWHIRKFEDNDQTMAMVWLEKAGLQPTHSAVGPAVMAAARANEFNPVRAYFDGLKWDGFPRVQGGEGVMPWLSEYMGVAQSNHGVERAFGMRWLIAAVARNLSDKPAGEKVDNMLIIEGAQGKMKSTALEVLGTMNGERYFTDDLGDIGSKDAVMQLQGNVIVEIAELDALNKADAETIKKWVARKVDAIRLPYGKIVVDMPRRCVLAGTVNPSGRGYLKDATGARRFWPVLVKGDIDIAGLTRDRDQIWAEAVHLYRQGEPWWLQGDEVEAAAAVQALRYSDDPWAELIDEYLRTHVGTTPITTRVILTKVLEVPKHQQRDEHEKRVVAHLKSRGYEAYKPRIDGAQTRAYRKVER